MKVELADGAKVKKEKSAEQEISFERQDKEKMELDDVWLLVKREIKEEIEQEEQQEQAFKNFKSSSLDDLTPKEIMMKEEMEEEPEHHEAFESLDSQSDHSEVATQERQIDKSRKAANTEPEPKPVAKRRRLTRRDMQHTTQTGGPSSAKIELADGVKVKKEKSAEQEISFDRQDKEKMDDLWLRVHKKVNEQSLMTFAAASPAAGHALKPPGRESGASQVQTSTQLEPSPFGMEDASKSKADEDCLWV